MQRVNLIINRRDSVHICYCGDCWIVTNGSTRAQLINELSSTLLATLLFPATVLCCSTSSTHHTTVIVCLVDGRILSLSLEQVLTDLKLPSANDIGEDIFEYLLGSPDTVSDQNTPQSIHVDSYSTVIARFNCIQYIPNLLVLAGNILLLNLHLPEKKSATCINGYLPSSCKSSEYFHSFIITSEFRCSSMLIIHSGCSEASTAGTLVDHHLLASFFSPDVALSKCPILLYGTSAGQIFYVALSVHNNTSCAREMKSHLLLSLNQAIVDIFVVRVCQGIDVNLLVFVGKEGKLCILASYDKHNCFKEVCLNMPVYAACFVGNNLLLSSHGEITVLNFDFKFDDKNKESFCLNSALSATFCNLNTVGISGVLRMCVDTRRSAVIVAKRNGHIYTIDESYLRNYSALKGNDLQKAVTQVCEISKKVDKLKDNLKVTETKLKEVNNVIAIIRDLDVGSIRESLFSCQLLPKVYYKDIGVELQLNYHKTLLLSDSWYICVCFTFPKFHHQLCLSLSGNSGGNAISHFMKVAEKNLPFHVKCVLYHVPNGTRAPVGVSVVLRQEMFDVLKFVKVSDKNLVQSSLCTVKACLRVSKSSLKHWEDSINPNDVEVMNSLFSCGSTTRPAPMTRGQSTFQASSVIYKVGDSTTAHLYKSMQEDCVAVNLLANSPQFICELRAAIFERIKSLHSDAPSFKNCTLQQRRNQILSILNQLRQIGDQMNMQILDRENLSKQLFDIYQQLHELN